MKRLTFSAFLCIGTLVGLSQVSDAFAPWATNPASSNRDDPYAEQIMHLSNPDQSQEAVRLLIKAGKRAVPTLVKVARTHQDLPTRGWAIHSLAAIKSGEARATIEELARDSEEERLVRTWAWAALIQHAEELDELSALAAQSSGFPALERPISLQAVELAKDVKDTGTLLELVGRFPTLSKSLGRQLSQADSASLAEAMLSAKSQQARRLAAGYLASQGGRGPTQQGARNATIDALRFSRKAKAVPWAGGALYIPSMNWSRGDSLEIVGELLTWLLYCERQGMNAERQQVVNNLQSVRLYRPGGIRRMGGHTEHMLVSYGRAVGYQAAYALVIRSRTEDLPQVARALNKLRS